MPMTFPSLEQRRFGNTPHPHPQHTTATQGMNRVPFQPIPASTMPLNILKRERGSSFGQHQGRKRSASGSGISRMSVAFVEPWQKLLKRDTGHARNVDDDEEGYGLDPVSLSLLTLVARRACSPEPPSQNLPDTHSILYPSIPSRYPPLKRENDKENRRSSNVSYLAHTLFQSTHHVL